MIDRRIHLFTRRLAARKKRILDKVAQGKRLSMRETRSGDLIFSLIEVLPGDYTDYGGQVERWVDPDKGYPDCSNCRYFIRFGEGVAGDYGVCGNPKSHRAGKLTFEHQSGVDCFEDTSPADEQFMRKKGFWC